MKWNFDSDRPIYAQIIEHMKLFIVSGELKPGDRLASVRELAAEAEVNPNTMQRALSELERMGLMYSNRTSGRFITEDDTMIKQIKSEIAGESIRKFLESMKKIGFSRTETIEMVRNFEMGEDENE